MADLVTRGERGPKGDHGQDGRPGLTGLTGHDGETGGIGATGKAGKSGATVKASDRRLLILYVFVIVALVAMFVTLDTVVHRANTKEREFRVQIITNCEIIRDGNTKVNKVLDQLAQAALVNKNRTPAQRAEAVRGYQALHLPIQQCPPRG